MIRVEITGQCVSDAVCTLTLTGEHLQAAAETAFVAWLKERGYRCVKGTAQHWETPAELRARLGIGPKALNRKLSSKACPAFDAVRGSAGRLVYIEASPELEAFITSHKH